MDSLLGRVVDKGFPTRVKHLRCDKSSFYIGERPV